MTLVTCSDCGASISPRAASCPACGAPRQRKPIGCGGAILIVGAVLVAALYVQHQYQEAVQGKLERDQQRVLERGASGTSPPSFRDPVAEAQAAGRPAFSWVYNSSADEMTSRMITTAMVTSENAIEFDFPYASPQRATLTVRKHPRWGTDVFMRIERGQFDSCFRSCVLRVRFDDGPAEAYQAAEPDDSSSTTRFITSDSKFIRGLKAAKTVKIESTYFQEGARTFEFNVQGLRWP